MRYYVGLAIFILGFLSPLAIPLLLKTNLRDGLKTLVSGLLVFGGPEILMILAGLVMGKENLTALKTKVGSWIKPLVPPTYVSKPRFLLGISIFSFCMLESLVHVHWDGIMLWYADFALVYMIFWNVLFLLSLYILGGDFFNRLIGLFQYHNKKAE